MILIMNTLKTRVKSVLIVLVFICGHIVSIAQELTPKTWYINEFGVKQGVKEAWSEDNLGRKHGLYKRYAVDGTILQSIEYKNGVMNGVYYSGNLGNDFLDNLLLFSKGVTATDAGVPANEFVKGTMENGAKEGKFITTNKDGKFLSSITFTNDLKNGEAINYNVTLEYYDSYPKPKFSIEGDTKLGVKSYFKNDIFEYKTENNTKIDMLDLVKKASQDFLDKEYNQDAQSIAKHQRNITNWIYENIPDSEKREKVIDFISNYKKDEVNKEKLANIIGDPYTSLEDKFAAFTKLKDAGVGLKNYELFTRIKTDIKENKPINELVGNEFLQPIFTQLIQENPFVSFMYNDKQLKEKFFYNTRHERNEYVKSYQYDGISKYSMTLYHGEKIKWQKIDKYIYLETIDKHTNEFRVFVKNSNGYKKLTYIDGVKDLYNYKDVFYVDNKLRDKNETDDILKVLFCIENKGYKNNAEVITYLTLFTNLDTSRKLDELTKEKLLKTDTFLSHYEIVSETPGRIDTRYKNMLRGLPDLFSIGFNNPQELKKFTQAVRDWKFNGVINNEYDFFVEIRYEGSSSQKYCKSFLKRLNKDLQLGLNSKNL